MDLASPIPSDASWEMVSPTSPLVGTVEEGDDDEVVVDLPARSELFRQRSASTPDLVSYEWERIEEKDDEEFFDAQDDSVLTAPSSKSAVKKKMPLSFRDMVLSQVDELAKEIEPTVAAQMQEQQLHPRLKMKPKFVVTPIRRCTMSTPNLTSLVEEDEGEILGDTDASEFYNRKAMGYAGRQNGMKLRPDEAKRRDIVMYKKSLQRAAQQRG